MKEMRKLLARVPHTLINEKVYHDIAVHTINWELKKQHINFGADRIVSRGFTLLDDMYRWKSSGLALASYSSFLFFPSFFHHSSRLSCSSLFKIAKWVVNLVLLNLFMIFLLLYSFRIFFQF